MDEICQGFKFSGTTAGLYSTGKKDIGLILSDSTADAAGIFTKNKVKASPVILDIERIKSGKCRGILVNSGNANCCTGKQGVINAKLITQYAAKELNIPEQEILTASTGVIGEPLPVEKIKNSIPQLTASVSENTVLDFAHSIMTTDTVPKIVSQKGSINGKDFTITAIAKGSGMLKPDMATMLCFLLTDVEASPDTLKKTLVRAADRSLNRITVDGDTSTNDTVLILANRFSQINIDADTEVFQQVLDAVLLDIAKQLVRDGEGVTKCVEVKIKGAVNDKEARYTADTIGNSPLVKTAFFGEDANWGRILCAAGRAGVMLDPDKIDLFFDDVQMVKQGLGCGKQAESKATEVLKKKEFTVSVDLNIGKGSASVLTCDFSIDYVKINADYRS